MQDKYRRKIVVVLTITFALGYLFGSSQSILAETKDKIYAKLDVFAKVLHYVETNYVEEVDEEELINGAIKGMLDTLDPHTIYMPPDIYREMKIDTTGEFQGLGLKVESRDRRLVVVEPLVGTPAYKSGLKTGDVILAIDGKDTTNITLMDAVKLMRGPIGTQVTLTIQRAGLNKPKDFLITRDRIRTVSVEHYLLDNKIGYIRIKSFQDRSTTQMVAALQKMEAETKGPVRGLVLDLRGNPGGLLEEAIRMIDEFIPEGVIVTTAGRNNRHVEVERAHKIGSYLKGRIALLVDSGSASASEIVAGALQDHGRAFIIGSKSFGKGSVQNIIDLDDGSGLKITVARYYTPKKRSIDAVGIMPDLVVAPPEPEPYVAMSDDNLLLPPPEITDPRGLELIKKVSRPKNIREYDTQLHAAYAYLKLGKLPKAK